MSGVSSVTSQLNNIANCNGANCCDQIAALSARIATLEGRVQKAQGDASSALSQVVAATVAIGVFGGQLSGLTGIVAAISAEIAGILATLARLGALLAPVVAALPGILIAIASLGALALSVAAAQTAANAAYGLADTGLNIANSAFLLASNAMLRARDASSQAVSALGAALAASSKGDTAIIAAGNAQNTAASAVSIATAASATADRAIGIAQPLPGQISQANRIATAAQATADRAIAIAQPLPGRISDVERVIATAQATADRAIAMPVTRSTSLMRPGKGWAMAIARSDRALTESATATTTANAALREAIRAATQTGARGRDGASGRDGAPGIAGSPGRDGTPGLAGIPGVAGRDGAPGIAGSPGREGTPGLAGTPGREGTPGRAGIPGRDGVSADPTLGTRLGTAEAKIEELKNRPTILPKTPDRKIPISYPGTGEIVKVPTEEWIDGEFVEADNKIAKINRDIEPLKNDNNKNKAAIAVIQNTCCKSEPKTETEVKFVTITLKKFERCDPNTGSPIFSEEPNIVIRELAITERLKADKIADLQAQQCQDCNCVATVPEWWQIRPEANRPQGILVFREARPDGTIGNDNYAITIPHCTLTTPPPSSPLPNYEKGSFEGILTLKDNSKLIVNCKNAEECSRVIGRLSTVIDDNQLQGSSIKIGERQGLPFKNIEVRAIRLDYYPTGLKNMRPAYLKSFF